MLQENVHPIPLIPFSPVSPKSQLPRLSRWWEEGVGPVASLGQALLFLDLVGRWSQPYVNGFPVSTEALSHGTKAVQCSTYHKARVLKYC